MKYVLSVSYIKVKFPQFQLTIHSCYLIHNNIFKNNKLLHVSDRTGPSSGSVSVPVV